MAAGDGGSAGGGEGAQRPCRRAVPFALGRLGGAQDRGPLESRSFGASSDRGVATAPHVCYGTRLARLKRTHLCSHASCTVDLVPSVSPRWRADCVTEQRSSAITTSWMRRSPRPNAARQACTF